MVTTAASLAGLLRAALGGVDASVVDDGTRRRAEYSTDASNYRVVPDVVAFPRSTEDVVTLADTCLREGVPVTVRGAGTSCAGNAVGPGLVLDLSRHLHRVLEIDPDARTATVEPGAVLDAVQAAARPYGLRFGPDPSTHSRCTIGGMIGNNACGAHAMAYGTTAANVVALDVMDGRGRRVTAGPGTVLDGLDDLVASAVLPVAGELGRFGRQVSGYGLQHLLPDRGGDLAKALAGSEGTCAITLGATVRLVEAPAATALTVLGYPDMATAADAVGPLLPHAPLALEGIDARMVDMVRARRPVPDLPPGRAWLMVETGGSTPEEAVAAGRTLAADAGAAGSIVVPAGAAATTLWRIREDGAGLGSRTADGRPAWPAWEDAAVPPERLGAYLRQFEALLADHHLDGLLYGHFGDGCVHVRIDLPLAEHPERLRPFLGEAAALVASHGGSISGEHGDGRARSELLGAMYSPKALDAFAAFKALFDPDHLLNPGVLVAPAPVDADLRRPQAAPLRAGSGRRARGGFALHADGGDLTEAVHRCTGVAKCRADNSSSGGWMCPSWLATGDERDTTRGRARVLQELANGSLVGGWDSPEVSESLEYCLSCKACASDCPVSVDVATYKAEVLHQRYRRRRRPASHYALGWLPRWLAVAACVPSGVTNGALGIRPVARLLKRAAGIDPRRELPRLAPLAGSPGRLRDTAATARARWAPVDTEGTATGPATTPAPAPGPRPGRAVLWADSFTSAFSPQAAEAAVRLLTEAGWEVVVPEQRACCGLTWITTGQLDGARRRLRRLIEVLHPYVEEGAVVVGLEPSCTAVLRSDLVELVDTAASRRLAAATRTVAEAVSAAGDLSWLAGRLEGRDVIAQPHCHHHAVVGYRSDRALLEAAGASVTELAGCCGLAGNFGMEAGHYDVSVAVAEHALLPALRGAPVGAVLLADGFSCRTQADQLAGWPASTLAELLDPARRAPRPGGTVPVAAPTAATDQQSGEEHR